MKIYIAGKITGLDIEKAKSKFKEAQTVIEGKGHECINPMELPHDHDKTWESYMKECLISLLQCDALFALPDYKESRGAEVEYNLAAGLGMKIYHSLFFIPEN